MTLKENNERKNKEINETKSEQISIFLFFYTKEHNIYNLEAKRQ